MIKDRKWKHGDTGPDGRVFWGYCKTYKNGERWVTNDYFKKQRAKHNDYQQSPEWKSYMNGYQQSLKCKAYRQSPEYKAKEKARQQSTEGKAYKQCPEYKAKEKARMQTPEYKAYQKASRAKKSFCKRDGSSLGAFLDSYKNNHHLSMMLSAIMDLTVPDGKTLAEYIHDLSGYKMSVCEQIANLCKGEFPDA